MSYLKSYRIAIQALMEDSEPSLVTKEVFNPAELEQAFQMLDGHNDLSYSELMAIVDDHVIDWPRGKNSLRLLLIRMYALMHGDVPEGIMPNLEWYTTMTKAIVEFVEDKGFDVTRNYFHAIEEATMRIEAKKARKTRDQALQIMNTYYKSQVYSPKQVKILKSNRDQIIQNIENGEPVDQVFSKVLQ